MKFLRVVMHLLGASRLMARKCVSGRNEIYGGAVLFGESFAWKMGGKFKSGGMSQE